MSAVVLQVADLGFSYPARPVFTGWSADFAPGLTWVRGSNGSGKSTLLKLLVGALPPLTGSLRVLGIDQATAPLDYKREVYWCGPNAIAFDHLRAAEYFAFMRGLYPRFDADAATACALDLGLEPFMSRRLREMSTGTQRKVWLSAAFSAGTAVVLLDEPLVALDLASQRKVRERLARCADDMTTAWIVVSHEGLGEAVEARARVIELQEPAC